MVSGHCSRIAAMFILAAGMVLLLPSHLAAVSGGNAENSAGEPAGFDRGKTYESYIEAHKQAPPAKGEILVPGPSFTGKMDAETVVLENFQGVDNVLEWSNQKGWVEWTVDVPESGLYNLAMKYFPVEGKRRDIELELAIDGSIPFEGARKFTFNRVWKDAEGIARDNRDNDVMPQQVEAPQWREEDFKDTEGLYNDAYLFYFEKGRHTLRLTCVREPIALSYLRIYGKTAPPSYDEVAGGYADEGYKPASDALIKIQAEDAYRKSDPTLHPMNDKSSPSTEPYHYAKIRLNTLGSLNWRYPGQWVTWRFTVPEDGLYKLGFKYRQNFVRGFYTTRKVYIDGELPFSEMQSLKFSYNSQWMLNTPGGEEPYLFYLSKGQHEITMEATLGDMAETLRVVEESVYQLNYLYRKIIMITGVNPDKFRDYYLDREIPGLVDQLKELGATLKGQAERLEKITGHQGSEAVLLERISEQLESLAEEPDTIGERLDRYKSNVSTLAAWILEIKEQPLELDYLVVASPDMEFPRPEAGLIQKLLHHVNTFVASFLEDYNNIGNTYEKGKSVEVWMGAGRDQAQILKGMIDDMFTPETGITVNLKLAPGSLLQATMAGKGPDVALNVGRGEPVNLAIRGAVADLNSFGDFGEVKKRFFESALLPYEYRDNHYALPETQSFHMMFYRKDIFEELGIEPPKTWEELYRIYPVLQRNNMEIGIPYDMITADKLIYTGMGAQNLFSTLLFQNGGKFYQEGNQATALNEPASIKAFKEWTGFYTQYKFPLSYDFFNRFRTGEMPLGIQQYTYYSMFAVAAPEIRNLWEMLPIPGTARDNEQIDRTESASGSACMILEDAKNKEDAWKFIKWWTSAEVQSRFGRELETVMGPAARYNTANVEAFKDIPWSRQEYENLMEQWEQVREIPEIPGGYYTSRNIDNAFRQVLFSNENEREALYYWGTDTDKEIRRKRVEFGLD